MEVEQINKHPKLRRDAVEKLEFTLGSGVISDLIDTATNIVEENDWSGVRLKGYSHLAETTIAFELRGMKVIWAATNNTKPDRFYDSHREKQVIGRAYSTSFEFYYEINLDEYFGMRRRGLQKLKLHQ